jgi:hypothetical protein
VIPLPIQELNEALIRKKARHCLEWLKLIRASIRDLGRESLPEFDLASKFVQIALLRAPFLFLCPCLSDSQRFILIS